LAVAFSLSPMQARAIGMGAIEVKSRLDQPFVAEIPLTLNDPSEANDLVVHLASPEAFARIGLDRSVQVSANLTFSIGRNERGQQVIRVTTPQKMHDPYVSFLLEADWGKGKMVREYTALLDPPHSVSIPHRVINAPQVAATPMPASPPPPPAPMITPPSIAAGPAPAPQPEPQRMEPIPSISAAATQLQAPPQPPQPQISAAAPPPAVATPPPSVSPEAPPAPMPQQMTAPQPPPQPIAAATLPEPIPPPAPPPEPVPAPAPTTEPAPATAAAPAAEPAPAAATPDSVTVEKGDTLSQIAGKVRPEDVSVNRMMIALQRANPDAFIHSNINLLRSGAVLRIPGGEDTQVLTAAEADSLVHEQVESWRQGFQAAPPLQPQEGAETTGVAKSPKPAETAAAAPAEKPSAATKESAKPAETSTAETSAAPAPAAASVSHRKPRGARLEIVPPVGNSARGSQSGASEGGSGSELRAQLTQAKEELAARNSEISDLKSRVSDLEKIQKDSQQLITMKDSQLADLQHKLAELEKQKNAPAPTTSAAPATATAAPAASATTATAASSTAPPASTASSATASKPAVAPAKHPIVPPSEPTDETPWFLQTWFWFGAGSLLVAGLLYVFLRKPKKPEAAAPPRKYALAESLAALQTSAAKSEAKPEDEANAPVPAPAVTGRTTVAEPLPPAPPASKPYWTGPVAATMAPEPPAPLPPPAPVPQPAPVAAAAAPMVESAKDEWAMDETPAPASKGQEITKEHPVVPELDDPNQTVATKLELARAYIDIGDHDGARGMLEEVLIEGNAPQQEEAFKLLDTLDT
jgi:pilus assembly protein FimV